MEIVNKYKEKIILIAVFVLYCLIVITVGIHHEPWADEAQAFLYARDCSIKDLLFERLKYEGHPIVWYAILKFYIYTSLIPPEKLYENIFILPSVFYIGAMYLFLFKSKIPLIYKILAPFSFYLLYQYPIIARNHSLFFPMVVLVAIAYKYRLQKPYIYSILLIILANISAYSFVFSLVLLCFFTYDIYLKNKFNYKKYIPIVIMIIFFILTILYLRRPDDCTFAAKIHIDIYSIFELFFSFHECYFNYSNFLLAIYQMILVYAFYFLNIMTFCKNKKQVIFFIAINLPLFFVFAFLYQNDWHCGYAIIYLIFSIWILSEENKIKTLEFAKNKIFYIVVSLIFCTQIFWSFKSCIYDYKYNYCSSKDVAQYIKQNNLEKLNIAAFEFHTVAIQPYFKQNIYYNQKEAIYTCQKKAEEEIRTNMNKKVPDIIITKKDYGKNLTYKNKKYENKEFYSYMPSKGRLKESTSFNMYLRK